MSWWVDALCAEVGGEMWVPEPGGNPAKAKALCARCPAKDPCLEDALRDDTPGIFGGTTQRERRQIRRTRRDAA